MAQPAPFPRPQPPSISARTPSGAPGDAAERRVLVLAPTAGDAAVDRTLLSAAGLDVEIHADTAALLRALAAGAGALLLAEEALESGDLRHLVEVLGRQPRWSEIPVLVLAGTGADAPVVAAAMEVLDNVTVLERPVRAVTLVSALRSALRARARQYELRDRLAGLALYAAVVEGSDDAIISKTLEGEIVSWNAGAERLFGYTAAEAVGRSITLIIPPERRQEEAAILERLRAGERVEHFETQRVTKAGRRIDISLTISPIRDASGAIVGASKVARDLTARKRLESELREGHRRKDEFLATLAHELRNPLAPLRASLEILRLAGEQAATRAETVAMMERQLDQLVRLVDDLLELSRITRGTIELRRAPVELAAVVRSAVETSRPLLDGAGQELTLDLPEASIVLEADAVRLAQVLANLLNNAAKFTPAGGRIWLSARRAGDEVAIAIRDSGVGIPPETLPRIFEMFAQGDSPPREQRGLGIGLTLARRLVELHGGRIEARSEGRGRGSEFVVHLPVTDAAPAARPLPEPDPPSIRTRRVLVVDDNVDSAESLASWLELVGHEACVAHDGASALTMAGSFAPEVVLLDLGMPDLDGFEVARRLRAVPDFDRVRLVALTGYGREEDRRRSRAAGFDDHLVKPVNPQALAELLASDSAPE